MMPTPPSPDVDARTFFLLFYAAPGPTLVQSLTSLAYSRTIHRILTSLQPPPPTTVPPPPPPPLVHDDTTLALPPSVPGSATPFYPHAIHTITTELLTTLRLSLAVKKNVHFQAPLPASHRLSISRSLPHFHPGAKVTSSHYRLAGGVIGTPDGRRAYLSELSTTYHTRLTHFTSIPGVHAHGALLIIILCLRPQTTFNHHFRLSPPSITTAVTDDPQHPASLATQSNTAAVRAIAAVLRLRASQLLQDDANLTAFQALLPATAGGIPLPDATVLAPAAFAASFIDSLPTLRMDPRLEPILRDPRTWAATPLPTLAAFHTAFTRIATTPTLATPPAYDADLFTTVHTLLADPEFVFYICHRLGIPPPTISPAAARRCTRKCRTITAAKPLDEAHPLFPLHRLCLHHLHSSLTSQTKVDLLLTSALAEQATAIDFTVSCPLLPSYLAAAISDGHAIIAARADEKSAKHAAGSAARNRLFLPWVLTTFGGMGPDSI